MSGSWELGPHVKRLLSRMTAARVFEKDTLFFKDECCLHSLRSEMKLLHQMLDATLTQSHSEYSSETVVFNL